MIFEGVFLLLITLIKLYLIELYINKLTTTNYIQINNYYIIVYYSFCMLNLRTEVISNSRMLTLGNDLRLLFLRVVKVITSLDCRRLASTSSEMFRTLRLAPTGRKFDQKLPG